MTARDDDARLDAAAISLVLAQDRGDGTAQPGPKIFWVLQRLRLGPTGAAKPCEPVRLVIRCGQLCQKVVRRCSGDRIRADRESSVQSGAGPAGSAAARDSLDQGALDEAVRHARTAVNERPDLAACHAVLAEGLMRPRSRRAGCRRRATELNPALIDGWREMGDAYLEARQAVRARRPFVRDPARRSFATASPSWPSRCSNRGEP